VNVPQARFGRMFRLLPGVPLMPWQAGIGRKEMRPAMGRRRFIPAGEAGQGR